LKNLLNVGSTFDGHGFVHENLNSLYPRFDPLPGASLDRIVGAARLEPEGQSLRFNLEFDKGIEPILPHVFKHAPFILAPFAIDKSRLWRLACGEVGWLNPSSRSHSLYRPWARQYLPLPRQRKRDVESSNQGTVGIMSRVLQLFWQTLLFSVVATPGFLIGQQSPDSISEAGKNAFNSSGKSRTELQQTEGQWDADGIEKAKRHFEKKLLELKLRMDMAESEHLIVFSDLGLEETKAIAELSEKAWLISCRLLKLDNPKTLFPTKFVVLVLEKDQFFDSLQRAVFETSLTASRTVLWRLDGDNPSILISNLPSHASRTSGFSENWRQFSARFMGTVILLQHYPANADHCRLPVWVRNGFGLYASLLAQDDPALTAAYRKLFRSRLTDRTKMADFSSGPDDFYNFHVASLVEYLISYHDPSRFEPMIEALRKQRVVRDESLGVDVMLEFGWDRREIEREWRFYAITGKRLAR
jgi:hypothetical protein